MRTGLAILMCLTMWVMMQTANVSREEAGGEIFAEKDGYRACAALDGEETEKVRLKNLPHLIVSFPRSSLSNKAALIPSTLC